MRRIFLFLWTLALAALGWVLWQRRDDLKRSYGEWRAATDAAREGLGATAAARGKEPGRRAAQDGSAAGRRERPSSRVNGSVPSSEKAAADPSAVPGPASAQPAAEPGRCAAITGSGKRCTRQAEDGSRFCWQHAD